MKLIRFSFLYIIILLTFLAGCSTDNQELEGNWVIFYMTYQDKEVYPVDRTPNQIAIRVAGTEWAEKLNFQKADSTVIVPGFESEEMIFNYRAIGDDSVRFDFDENLLNEYKTRFLNYIYKDTLLASLSHRSMELENLKDSLNIIRDNIILHRGSSSKQYDLPKKIYGGTFRITKSHKSHQLMLKSSDTELHLVNEEYLTEQRINELFEGL